jgi:hypothetical protein
MAKRTRLNPELKNDIAWPPEVLREVVLQWFKGYRLVTHKDCRSVFFLAGVSHQFRDVVYSKHGVGQITYIQNGMIEQMPSWLQPLYRGLLELDITWLRNNPVIDQCDLVEKLHVRYYQNALPVKPTLRELVVFGPMDTFHHEKLLVNFDANPWLIKLDLSNYSGEVGKHGLSALVNLEHLILQRDAKVKQSIKFLTNLKILEMPGAKSPITEDTLLLLTKLHTLNISGNHSISSDTLRLLPNLTSLDLTGSRRRWRELDHLNNLRRLNLTQCPGCSYKKLVNLEWLALPSLLTPSLEKLKHLTKLRLLRIHTTDRIPLSFIENHPFLTHLIIPSVERIAPDALALLQERGGKVFSTKSHPIKEFI